ncbi:MAG: hypothetical protein R3C39_07830 [Dehalococcoidia bacterium]
MNSGVLTRRGTAALDRALARDLAIAAATGLGVVAAKHFLDFGIGVPGHAGLSWVAVLLFGASRGRAGTGVASGIAVGLWGVPLGLGHSMGYNMALYATAGGVLDAWRLTRLISPERFLGAVIAGTSMHLAKLAYITSYASATGLVKHFHVVGFLPTAFNHALFGAGAGILAWLALRATHRGRRAG